MCAFYLIQSDTFKKIKFVIKRLDHLKEAINFVQSKYNGSVYLKDVNTEQFLSMSNLADGIYIIIDDNLDLIKVYKLDTITLNGYIYNSTYIIPKQIDEYEMISEKITE